MMDSVLRLVFWELTGRCNLRCRHCRASAGEAFSRGELTTDQIISAARAVRRTADPIVVLTGGEPLERPDFFEIAAGCGKIFSRIALATNGTRVDEEVAGRIVDGGIQRVSVSLDGASEKTHDDFRGIPGSFKQAVDGFNALKRAGASLQINMTVTRHNENEIDDLMNMALRLEAQAFHLFMLVPVGCGVTIREDQRLSPERSEEILEWLFEKSLALRGRLHIKATCAPQYFRIMQEVSRRRNLPAPEKSHGLHATTRGCLAGSGVCFISRTGDVQPCGYLPVRAGNVRDQEFRDIWETSPVFRALRDPGNLTGKCGRCRYRVLCQGCRARAYAASGDFLAEEPDCPHLA
jgi:AdoMet-dependent heme synthase